MNGSAVDWIDQGIVLASRPYGEGAAIVSALTAEHGRHAGLVQGGLSARQRPIYQSGNLLRLEWRARLTEHLGRYRGELIDANAARVLDDATALAGLLAACSTIDAALPEREPHPALFEALSIFVGTLGHEGWPMIYVRLELGLLQELGYGLDLASCALTGETTDLAYVSPRTGRAVTRQAGIPWRDKLLALPPFLAGDGVRVPATSEELANGLALTGHFLEHHVFWPHNKPLPPARGRLMEILQRNAADKGGE